MVVKGLQLQTSEGICHFLIGDNPLLMKQLQCNAQVFPSDTFGGGTEHAGQAMRLASLSRTFICIPYVGCCTDMLNVGPPPFPCFMPMHA